MIFFRRYIPFFLIRTIKFLKWVGLTSCILFIIDACDTRDSVIPAQDQVFIKLYGGSGSEEGRDLVVLPNEEGFVVVGSSTSKSGSIEKKDKDVYVVRTDQLGNVVWENRFGGDGDDIGSSVILGSNNSIYVCGEKTQESLNVLGLRDVYVLNINLSDGSLIGNENIYGDVIKDEYGTDIIELDNGGFFISSTNLRSDSSTYFLIETDINLDTIPLRSRYIGIEGGNNLSSVSFDYFDPNNPFICFGTTDKVNDEINSNRFQSFTYKGISDQPGIVEYYGTELYEEYCTDSRQTVDGGYILGGLSDDGVLAREMVVKIDERLGETWKRVYSNEFNKSIKECGIIQTMDRGYIISSTIELEDPKNDEISLLKLSELGEEEWRKTYGSNDDDMGAKVAQLSDGSYVVVGTIGFEINPDSKSKMCLMKLNPEGDLVPMN